MVAAVLGRHQPAPAVAQHRLHGRWGSWQQQQAARAALDQALTLPTLSCRPLLIASLLQPLFASLGRQLAGKAGTVSAIRAAGVSNPLRSATGGLADEGTGVGANSGAAGGISAEEPSVADWRAVRGPVLQQLRAVVTMDSEQGMNRALAHGLLFQCWSEVKAIEYTGHSCEDSLEPWRDCQISTEVYGHLVAEMGWGDLAAHALQWQLPNSNPVRVLQQQCHMVKILIAACPGIAGGLMAGLLSVPGIPRDIMGSAQGMYDSQQCPAALVNSLVEVVSSQQSHIVDASTRQACLAAIAGHVMALLGSVTGSPTSIHALEESSLPSTAATGDCNLPDSTDYQESLDLAMGVLQDLLIAWPEAETASSGISQISALAHLASSLEARVISHISTMAAGGGSSAAHSDSAARFQSCCHLKARLAMCGVLPAQLPSVSSPDGGVRNIRSPAAPHVLIFQNTDRVSAYLAPASIRSPSGPSGLDILSNTSNSSSAEERLAATVLLRAIKYGGTDNSKSKDLSGLWMGTAALERDQQTGNSAAENWESSAAWDQVRTLSTPAWQSPISIAAVCLQLLREVLLQRDTWPVDARDWQLLCSFLAGASARVTDGAQHLSLLELALESEELKELRAAAAEDSALQSAVAQHLIVVSNHMIEESKAAVRVFAEQSVGVVAAAAQLLPCAVLAPEAIMKRLLTDGVQHSGQAGLVVQLLSHLSPLARYQTPGAAQAALPTCLAHLLLTSPGLLVTDAAKAGFKGLLRYLQMPPSPTGIIIPQLLSSAQVLMHLVLPGLESAVTKYAPEANSPASHITSPESSHSAASFPAAAAAQKPAADLQLVLELGISSLGGAREREGWPASGEKRVPGSGRLASGVDSPLETIAGQLLENGTAVQLLEQLCLLLDARPPTKFSIQAGNSASAAAKQLPAPGGVDILPIAAVTALLQLAEMISHTVADYALEVVSSEVTREVSAGEISNPALLLVEAAQEAVAALSWRVSWQSRLVLAPLVPSEAALKLHLHSPTTALQTYSNSGNASESRIPGSKSLSASLQASSLATVSVGVQAAATAYRAQPQSPACQAVKEALLLCRSTQAAAAAFAVGCTGSTYDLHTGMEPNSSATVEKQPYQLAMVLRTLPQNTARQALLSCCVELLPWCTPVEYSRITSVALPAWLEFMAGPPSVGSLEGGGMNSSHAGGGVRRAAAEASMLQLSSRAAFLLVQQNGTAEDDVIQVGLEQMLHHIGAHCKRLTEVDLTAAAAGAASRGAKARTCLQEVVQLVGALQGSAAWGRHTGMRQRCGAAAQVLLLHLVKVIGDTMEPGGGGTVEWLNKLAMRVQEPLRDMLQLAIYQIDV